jgi:hypothetical protein
LTSGVTGQTGDGHRSDWWPPKVEPESPYLFSDPPSVEPTILIKFNREALSVEPTYPR